MSTLQRPAGTWGAAKAALPKARNWRLAATVAAKRVEQVKPAQYSREDPGVIRCVRCSIEVNPGMTHRARVYTGDITIEVAKTATVYVNPGVNSVTRTLPTDETSKLKLPKFSTGHVCDTCCADYSHVTLEHKDGTTESIQRVVTLPRPVAIVRDQTEGTRSNKGFSKRIHSRGNTGSRHKRDNYYSD
jgi:hypothetical protein